MREPAKSEFPDIRLHNLVEGHFMESMNDYVVRSAIRFAYGASEEGRPVAERFLRRPSDPVIPRW